MKSIQTPSIQKNCVMNTAKITSSSVFVIKWPCLLELIMFRIIFHLIDFWVQSAHAEYDSWNCPELNKSVILSAWSFCRWQDRCLSYWASCRSTLKASLRMMNVLLLVLNLDPEWRYLFSRLKFHNGFHLLSPCDPTSWCSIHISNYSPLNEEWQTVMICL